MWWWHFDASRSEGPPRSDPGPDGKAARTATAQTECMCPHSGHERQMRCQVDDELSVNAGGGHVVDELIGADHEGWRGSNSRRADCGVVAPDVEEREAAEHPYGETATDRDAIANQNRRCRDA